MTLKAVRQLTNIAWIIGGVSAATAGYSYVNSRKEQVFVDYTRKALGTISTVEDIEDYEKQRGCLFLFFTKQEAAPNKPSDVPRQGELGVIRPAPARTSGPTSSAKLTKASAVASPAARVLSNPNIPKYNEWNNGGVLSARNYIAKNEQRKESVIKRAEAMKEQCQRGKIIYEEIDDEKAPNTNVVPSLDDTKGN
ncbi:hypothetical protein A6V39_03570 [Candidatus Mycoplasma haematobovis]|uniref:Uncharacterized protein n=1 Tax=Candidatus Mycoplasma haematobovis TaxID=432608 RepID=A0A1A9QDD5_9MOLU|nr:hypothetical protein [Candidatus Mycoplasma haematobovis]OAL09965.1 hypothetical protein A6V39_03570 [Candidatus Mycoplasma haematobovis]